MQLRQDFEKLHLRSTFPSLNRQVTNEMPTGSLGFQKCLNIGIANLEGGGGGGAETLELAIVTRNIYHSCR